MELYQGVLQVLCILPSILAQEQDCLKFPTHMTIGAGSAAYQIEGGWNASDKGISTWDRFTHQKPSPIDDGSTGDIACDSYHKYKEDVAIAKNIGLNHYRFSLSWTRILPTGYANKISEDGIQYYKDLIDELRSEGIEPFVTIYHWDHPAFMDSLGSWTNELMVEYFADYARIVFRELGDKVKFWTTINEIGLYCDTFLLKSVGPESDSPPRAKYLCVHNMLKAHAKAYHIYDDEFRPQQQGKIGLATLCKHAYPVNENDSESSRIAFEYECGWEAHPIFSADGDYPEIMKTRIAENSETEGLARSRLPEFTKDEIDYIRNSSDYFGLNHYTSLLVESVPKINETYWYADSGVKLFANRSWPITMFEPCRIKPEGIREILNDIKKAYNNIPIYILENGAALSTDIDDTERISFLYSYMKQVFLAVQEDSVDVRSYTVWSLMDDFEWRSGYTLPFGLVHVDFNHPNRTRTMRLSSKWLREVIRRRELFPYDSMSSCENL